MIKHLYINCSCLTLFFLLMLQIKNIVTKCCYEISAKICDLCCGFYLVSQIERNQILQGTWMKTLCCVLVVVVPAAPVYCISCFLKVFFIVFE